MLRHDERFQRRCRPAYTHTGLEKGLLFPRSTSSPGYPALSSHMHKRAEETVARNGGFDRASRRTPPPPPTPNNIDARNAERHLPTRPPLYTHFLAHPSLARCLAVQLKVYLAEAFPHVPVADEIADAELQRFAESQGGRFPDPQYCPGLHCVVGGKKSQDGSGAGGEAGGAEGVGGVALLGDAIHAFPPDLGQVCARCGRARTRVDNVLCL